MLADSFRQLMKLSSETLKTQKCKVQWVGEDGMDCGGLTREFFFKLSRSLFNPYYGLFQYSAYGSYTVQISPFSSQIDDAIQWFQFAGRVIGYAIIQGQLLDVFFSRHFYKSLLNKPFTLSDIESVDTSFYNSLVYIQENDPESLQLTFSIEEEVFGDLIETDLKKNGSKIAVTQSNKNEYIKLLLEWRLTKGIKPQMEALVAGLTEMVPLHLLSRFDAQELEWVIAGTPEINVDDWRNNTEYTGGYSATHNVVIWFWEIVESYTNEQKLRLLQFVTGTSSVPFEGFKALRGNGSLQRFQLQMTGAPNSLPVAHTCFNRLDLPCYSSKQQLREKLTTAFEESEFFAIS